MVIAPHAALVEHVYAELRRLASHQMARETPGHTLQPTALVHEVYLRLMGDRSCPWDDRRQILAAAALTMRRLLVESGRRRHADRRGGQLARVELRFDEVATEVDAAHIADLDDALVQLEAVDHQMARVVELRYFGGLTIEETASVIDVSPRTVRRDLEAARLWLFRKMGGDEASNGMSCAS
jgi:RNA polymerase sigma factor (TIGR02999 family)